MKRKQITVAKPIRPTNFVSNAYAYRELNVKNWKSSLLFWLLYTFKYTATNFIIILDSRIEIVQLFASFIY